MSIGVYARRGVPAIRAETANDGSSMSRIADALKRAEQERRQHLDADHDAPAAPASLPPLPRPVDFMEAPALAPTEPAESADPKIASPSPALVEKVSESLVPFYQRSSIVTEQYRALRTRLLSTNPNYEHRVIAITSALPKEGKSVTSLNLGCILAEIHHIKVLVVDCDFRRGSLARMLNQEDRPGLADVLAERATLDQVVRPTPVPNLNFIPAGSTHGRSAPELLTNTFTRDMFRRMNREYHYVVVDTPPLTTVTDMGIIGPMCDGAIVVVRLHRTVEVAARRAVRLLQVNNIPVLGCLLVGRDAPVGRYGYGYGYGYRYQYYYRYYNYTHKEGTESEPKKRKRK